MRRKEKRNSGLDPDDKCMLIGTMLLHTAVDIWLMTNLMWLPTILTLIAAVCWLIALQIMIKREERERFEYLEYDRRKNGVDLRSDAQRSGKRRAA